MELEAGNTITSSDTAPQDDAAFSIYQVLTPTEYTNFEDGGYNIGVSETATYPLDS